MRDLSEIGGVRWTQMMVDFLHKFRFCGALTWLSNSKGAHHSLYLDGDSLLIMSTPHKIEIYVKKIDHHLCPQNTTYFTQTAHVCITRFLTDLWFKTVYPFKEAIFAHQWTRQACAEYTPKKIAKTQS